MNEHTTFEEKIVENEAQIPSFTLCPTQPIDPISNKSIESFEDVEKAVENVRDRFTMVYTDYKPYEDYKIVNYKYNDTSSGIWYFVPKVSMDPPFETVICLIWTPSREHKIKPDWSVEVNLFFNFKGGFQLLDLILPEIKSHVIPYKFKSSHWLRANLVKDFFLQMNFPPMRALESIRDHMTFKLR